MNFFSTRLALALLGGSLALPVLASSTAASSASDSIGTSVGSLSGSIENSSKASSGNKPVAEGPYRVIEVAEAADRPDQVRLAMRPAAATAATDADFVLVLPRAVVDTQQLAAGQLVDARHRPYGLEFAKGDPRQPFFLVLADEWLRGLQTAPVAL